MILDWHPEAREELAEAATWYGIRTTGRDEHFLDEVFRVISRVIKNPDWRARVHAVPGGRRYRCAKLTGYPYIVLFRANDEVVTIVSILHTSRASTDWIGR